MAGANANANPKPDAPPVNPVPQDQLPPDARDDAPKPDAPAPASAKSGTPKKMDVVLLQAVHIDGVEHPKGAKLSLDPKFVVRCLLAAGGSIANDLCEPLAAHEAKQRAAELVKKAQEDADKIVAEAMAALKASA